MIEGLMSGVGELVSIRQGPIRNKPSSMTPFGSDLFPEFPLALEISWFTQKEPQTLGRKWQFCNIRLSQPERRATLVGSIGLPVVCNIYVLVCT